MSDGCSHDCSNCSSKGSCEKQDLREKPNKDSRIKKVIGVVSGKGGVGKSLVTSLLAVSTRNNGKDVAILDADITGPSIPKAFGLKEKANGCEEGIFPVETKKGIKVMSLNLLMEDEAAPVVWRGPVIAGAVKQFWTDVMWGDIDYMFVDMPPGTGDVPLTVYQSLPISGIVVVTSPQELVGLIVEKAIRMAGLMNIPVLGIVENMSYFKCPDCGHDHFIFGKSNIEEVAEAYDIPVVCRLPINPEFAANVDKGNAEALNVPELKELVDFIQTPLLKKMCVAVPYDNGKVYGHFGHTKSFKIYNIEDKKVTDSSVIENNFEGHDAVTAFLATLGVNGVIVSGIGEDAFKAMKINKAVIFKAKDMDADEAVEKLLKGELEEILEAEGHCHEGESCCHSGSGCCH
ncbi:MAG: P-loop NTPase [Sphaerochaetaceae bacterium]|nr:P-loop NTPase [Sphaerochaetaceae bacterium]